MWVTSKNGQLVNLDHFQEVRGEDEGRGECSVGAIGAQSYALLHPGPDYATVKRVLEIIGNALRWEFSMINLQDLDAAEQAIRQAEQEEGVF